MNMKKYIGKKWGELTIEQQEYAYQNIIDYVGGDGNSLKIGECIVDFNNYISICGELIEAGDYPELIIDDNSIFYDSREGIIV